VTPRSKGLLVAALHVLIIGSIGAKFLYDRSHYPSLWVETAPYDPDMPIRGRYVSIGLLVDVDRSAGNDGSARNAYGFPVRLEVRGDRLVAVQDNARGRQWVTSCRRDKTDCWQLVKRVAYFIPEHATDPSRRPQGEALWAEVTVPPNGPPRPIRLGLKKNGGAIEPIAP
jgi:hypothetical protein